MLFDLLFLNALQMERELKFDIAENLRKHRVLRGYTQDYIAAYLGKKDYTAYSRYEQGRSNLKMEDAVKLSELYQVPVQELVIGSPSVRNNPKNGNGQSHKLAVVVELDGNPSTMEEEIKKIRKLNELLANKDL